MDLLLLCRLCLKSSGYNTNMFTETIADKNLYQLINNICELRVFQNDGLPECICGDCFQSIKRIFSFKTRAKEAETTLMRMKRNQNTIFIKQEEAEEEEVKSNEEAADSGFDHSSLHVNQIFIKEEPIEVTLLEEQRLSEDDAELTQSQVSERSLQSEVNLSSYTESICNDEMILPDVSEENCMKFKENSTRMQSSDEDLSLRNTVSVKEEIVIDEMIIPGERIHKEIEAEALLQSGDIPEKMTLTSDDNNSASQEKMSTNNVYCVIEFEDGVQLLPFKWVKPQEKKAYWPNFRNHNIYDRAVEDNVKADEKNWNLYTYKRIMYKTDSFQKGKEKLREAEELSDLHTDAEEAPIRRKRKPLRFLETDISSEEKLIDRKILPPLPKSPQIIQGIIKKRKGNLPEPQPNQAKHAQKSPKSDAVTVGDDSQFSTLMRGISDVKVNFNLVQSMLLDISERMIALETKGVQGQSSSGEELCAVLNAFPLDTVDGLEGLEARLRDDPSFQNCLSSALRTLGGVDVKMTTLNIMRKMMTNNLANQYSWIGLKKKRVFSSLRLNKVIQLAVRKHHSMVTDEEVSVNIRNWLRLAKLRMDREMSKSVTVLTN